MKGRPDLEFMPIDFRFRFAAFISGRNFRGLVSSFISVEGLGLQVVDFRFRVNVWGLGRVGFWICG